MCMCKLSGSWLRSFFFQAEDGIRDHCVTGVQTCALSICACSARQGAHHEAKKLTRATPPARSALARPGCLPRPGRAKAGAGWSSSADGSTAGSRRRDRKSVVEGKRVDLGGRPIIKKKKQE